MKIYTLSLMILFCAVISHGGVTLDWQKDLTIYASDINSKDTKIVEYSDGSVALAIPQNSSETTILAFQENGDLKIQDTFPAWWGEIKGNLRNPNVITVRAYLGSSQYSLRLYEIQETTNIVTIISGGEAVASSDCAGNPSVLFAIEGTTLKKYLIDTVPTVIESNVASGVNGSNFMMSWDSGLGVDYQIQSSGNLTNWTDVGSSISGTGSKLSWANALTNSQSFYRIIEE